MRNREVYAVPGNITSRNSFGTNYLIKGAGAKLVQTWQDVVSEFPADVAARILPPRLKGKGKGRPESDGALAGLTEGERRVWPLLPADAPVHIDALAEKSGLPVQALAGVLLSLEMRGLVRQLPGKCFARKI